MTIFKDVGQAVHFAFVMEQYPERVTSSLLHDDLRGFTAMQFGNMKPAELRAECAKIRGLVWASLPLLEASALVARFSHDQLVQTGAIIDVADHFAPQLRDKGDAVLIRRVFVRHYIAEDVRGTEWTIRSLADWHRVSKDRVQRLAKLVDQHVTQIEAQAMELLRVEFERRGITRIKEAA